MQTHEMDAWLGPAREGLTDEQYTRLLAEADEIERRHPETVRAGRDYEAERTAALSAAVQYITGEATTESAGAELLRARAAASEAMAASRQIARMAALDGAAKAGAAREAGIDRMTLLHDLGER